MSMWGPNSAWGSPKKDKKDNLPKYHSYLSTYCYHEDHLECHLFCKVCEELCICKCHEEKK